MIFAAQQRLQDSTAVFEGMIKINDLYGGGKTKLAHIPQPRCAVDEQHDFLGAAQPATNRLPPQGRTKFIDGAEARKVSRRFIVADRMARFIAFVLCKEATQIGHASFGATVGLLDR